MNELPPVVLGPVVLWADLAGIFVSALGGALLAVRHKLDVFGVFVLAIVTGLAGGMARDVLIGATPVAALANTLYLPSALAAGAVVFFGHRVIERASQPVMLFDAMALGFFAVAGARKALTYGIDPLPAVLLGVLTAVGGGALRDVLLAEVPRVLKVGELYALAAMLGATIVVAGDALNLPSTLVGIAGALGTFALRMVSVRFGLTAPRAPGSD
ncbi:trimeric intracellular cation channel family protein [Sphingosinicella microcystinivorans]|uniref:Membrane protein n=1 Tax=Sphingosinicella microcystinivorans TaxID=335406 RepID=A0AAD1D8P1_SPHMI|nr:trimeric intracellular cation channel family protein [Sphingosinicella microcystinivorans]RKS88121.1 putative membrane protein YeiH [Sphingosinicella microcystinivorans]BBE35932.1 membrane protein [Sphingosinicella microcystinivorans]